MKAEAEIRDGNRLLIYPHSSAKHLLPVEIDIDPDIVEHLGYYPQIKFYSGWRKYFTLTYWRIRFLGLDIQEVFEVEI